MRARDERALTDLSAPDILVEDRRPIVGSSMRGAESAVANWMAMQTIADRGTHLRSEVATRGDRLALVQLSLVGGSALVDALVLSEVDGDERCKRRAVFSVGDEDAAYVELDAPGSRVGGRCAPAPRRLCRRLRTTHDLSASVGGSTRIARSWITLPRAGGTFTMAEYLAYCHSMFELSDEARVRALEVVAAERWGFLTRFRISGRRDGGYFAEEAWIVSGIRDGRIARHEQFPLDRFDDACEAYDGLPSPRTAPVLNAASRHAERFHAAVSSGDTEGPRAAVRAGHCGR